MKKLLLFFGLICMINLMSAQETVTIHQNGHDFQVSAVRSVTDYPASNIQFWVGNGSNSVVAVFKWCQNTTMGIAYGYRWDGSATIYDMLTGIAAADSRFTVTFNSSNTFINNIMYQDDSYNEYFETDGYCTYTFNGGMASGLSDALTNNGYFELEEWGDCYPFPTTTMIVPATDPNGGTSTDPVDASLPFSQLLYWVGSGSNSAEFIVNFAQPDTAFAWGYRFDGTTTAQAMIDAIAAADPRFWTVGTPSYNGDIHFVLDNGDTLGLSPVDPAMGYNFWWANLNGISAGSGSSETLHNNDVFKYGDMNSAIGWDPLGTYFLQEAWVKVPTPVTPPAAPVEPDTLCTTVHPLTYSENFASYTSDQSMRPYFASAPIPECWTVLGNGTVHHVGTGSSTTADYFGGVGYSTSTNSFGAIAANDAFFSFIASQIYTGSNTSHINDMLTTGTRRYAVLPAFDSPLSQTVLTFDHRTNIADANAHLVVGYIVNDTADFVALETYTADNKVLHHDTIHFSQYANVPAAARLTLMWDVASTTASTTGPGNRYCGIDNLTVALAVVDTTPVIPVPDEANIAANDILFWVGTGSNEAVMAVNWADTALAWGYRWDGTATVADMMAGIAAADPRFSYSGTGLISDINYIDTAAGMTTPLGITPGNWWGSTNNGVMDMGMAQTLNNGDLEKWADSSTGILVDSVWVNEYGGYWNYIYVYPMTIYPVTVPDTTTTPVNPDPEDATISADAITYWVGTGNTEVIFVGNWCSPEVALAWGVRFNGTSTTVEAVMDTIAAYDSRFNYSGGGGIIYDVTYQDANYNLTMTQSSTGFVMYNVNGTLANFGYTDMYVSQGDLIKVGNTACATQTGDPSDWTTLGYAWQTPIVPVSAPAGPIGPTPEEATIDFSEILFWVGTGSNEAVMAVNWADTALAWGYRWDGTATVADMMAHIAAADPRFSYSGTGLISDINYIDTAAGMTTPLGITPGNYWESKNNGIMDAGTAQTLVNGDFEKWADPAAGVVVDSTYWDGWGWSYTYVYPMTITPVTVPDTATTPVITDPEDATISADAITYWVGTGNTEVIFAGNWCSPDVALAWGVRFNGTSTTVEAVMDTIAAYDSRFNYSGGGGILYDVTYQDANYNLTMMQPTTGFIMYNVNGTLANFGYTDMYVTQGDLIKVGNTACATQTGDPADWTTLGYVWQTPIVPVSAPAGPIDPTPEEATIAFSDILFWVGTGSNEAVMAVNWADTALAWGYRWNGTATVADMMAHIAAADPRFSYSGTGMVSDINYIDTAAGMTTPLGITPGNWWGSTNNGVMDMGMAQTLNNGDLEKWADNSTGILVDSVWVNEYGGYWNYIYVYPMTIYPVTVPDTTGGSGPDTIPEHGPFCGAVGTDGCNAIAVDDNQFVAWATNVVLTRGPQNISNPNSPLASFGDETNAIGPATPNNSMDAVSLGDGGSALVTFERPIRNGEGPDFAVFENDINGGFLELAFVEVSSDGVHFVRFPATSLTQTETQTGSFALTDPTFINNLAGKFQIGYGTPFDLEELADSANINIDSIVYVRIIDVVGNIDPQYATYDAFGHIVNDPWPTDFASCGFDLTGVGVIHQKSVGIESHEMPQVFAYPNPCTGTLYIINENAERVELYNLNGKLLQVVDNGDTHVTLNMQSYPAGLYLLKVGNGVQKILNK
ncbi:MAG: T9SS type A sorting domain-containing protein [Bacteroidales bacterium]|nr:T9SS type A sorting domain-containing protein [Bacteroidales bacterium]